MIEYLPASPSPRPPETTKTSDSISLSTSNTSSHRASMRRMQRSLVYCPRDGDSSQPAKECLVAGSPQKSTSIAARTFRASLTSSFWAARSFMIDLARGQTCRRFRLFNPTSEKFRTEGQTKNLGVRIRRPLWSVTPRRRSRFDPHMGWQC